MSTWCNCDDALRPQGTGELNETYEEEEEEEEGDEEEIDEEEDEDEPVSSMYTSSDFQQCASNGYSVEPLHCEHPWDSQKCFGIELCIAGIHNSVKEVSL